MPRFGRSFPIHVRLPRYDFLPRLGQDIGTGSGSTAFTITVSRGTPKGATILVSSGAAGAQPSVTDSAGNTYTGLEGGSDGLLTSTIFVAKNAAAIAVGGTITITPASGVVTVASAAAFAGLAPTTPLDQGTSQSDADTGLSASPSSGTTGTTALPTSLLYGCIVTAANSVTGAAALAALGIGSSGTTVRVAPFYQLLSATGTYAVSGTQTLGVYSASAVVLAPKNTTEHFEFPVETIVTPATTALASVTYKRSAAATGTTSASVTAVAGYKRSTSAASTPSTTSSGVRSVPRSVTASSTPGATVTARQALGRVATSTQTSTASTTRLYSAFRLGSASSTPNTTATAKSSYFRSLSAASTPTTTAIAVRSVPRSVTASSTPVSTVADTLGKGAGASTTPSASVAIQQALLRTATTIQVFTTTSVAVQALFRSASSSQIPTTTVAVHIAIARSASSSQGPVTTVTTLQALLRSAAGAQTPGGSVLRSQGTTRPVAAASTPQATALAQRHCFSNASLTVTPVTIADTHYAITRTVVTALTISVSSIAQARYVRTPSTSLAPSTLVRMGRAGAVSTVVVPGTTAGAHRAYAQSATTAVTPVTTGSPARSAALLLSVSGLSSVNINTITIAHLVYVMLAGTSAMAPTLNRNLVGAATWLIHANNSVAATMILSATAALGGAGGLGPVLGVYKDGQAPWTITKTLVATGGLMPAGAAAWVIGHTFTSVASVTYAGASTWIVRFNAQANADPIPSGLTGANRLLSAQNEPIRALLQACASVRRTLLASMAWKIGDMVATVAFGLPLANTWTGVSSVSALLVAEPVWQQTVTMPAPYIVQTIVLESESLVNSPTKTASVNPANFTFYTGDTIPAIRAYMFNMLPGTPRFDLIGATVFFRMRKEGSRFQVFTTAQQVATILDAGNGIVEYDFPGPFLARGVYVCQWEVVLTTGATIHSPQFTITVDLAV